MKPTREELLRQIYSPRDNDELREGYDTWASDYDSEMERQGYRLPGLVTVLMARHVPAGAGPILDAGAGTGLLGEWLALAGYGRIEALDLSPGMLTIAEGRGVYGRLHCADMAASLDIPDCRFDAVASAGAFGITHAPAAGFRELARVTRPGGHIVMTVRVEGIDEGGFADEAARLEAEGLWRKIETLGPFLAFPGEEESRYVAWVFQRTDPEVH